MSRIRVELVVHAWAEQFPHYASALTYLLSSLVIHRPSDVDVKVSLCCNPADSLVMDVAIYFAKKQGVELGVYAQDVSLLGRRCIGRNVAAKRTDADLVWFTDVDHVFGEGCIDTLVNMGWLPNVVMKYPNLIQIHKDHATGDMALEIANGSPCLLEVDPSAFVDKKYDRAIGGVQIVRGDFAHRHGYLDGDTTWQKARTDGKPFKDFRDDIAYREFCLERGVVEPIELPNLFRIRHSETTYQGKIISSE